MAERDFLDKMIAKRTARSPEFPQSFVARLESTAADAKISTVDRYAETLGYVVQYHFIPVEDGADEPAVVVHK